MTIHFGRPCAAGILIAGLFATPAAADSSLGFLGANLTYTNTPATASLSAAAGLDLNAIVAITDNHGTQLDVGYHRYGNVNLGHVGLHLYMTPQAGQKYGIFGDYADVDDASGWILSGGVEGQFAIGDRMDLDLRAGAGFSRPSGLDFVFISAGVNYALSDRVTLKSTLAVQEYHEATLNAIGVQTFFGLEYQPAQSPFVITAGLASDGMFGEDSQPVEHAIQLGLTYKMGATRNGARPFTSIDPIATLKQRNLFTF